MECNVDAGSAGRRRSCSADTGANRRSVGLPAGQVGESRPKMLAIRCPKRRNS